MLYFIYKYIQKILLQINILKNIRSDLLTKNNGSLLKTPVVGYLNAWFMLSCVFGNEVQYSLGAFCRFLDKTHMSRFGKAHHFCLRVVGYHLFRRFV